MHPHLNIAIKAARSAGNLIIRSLHQRDKIEVATKLGPSDLVTSVDKAAELEIISIIHQAYPHHNVLGEEGGKQTAAAISEGYGQQIKLDAQQSSDSDVVWIIDPLDGTMNFVHGFPHYVVSIAVQKKGIMEHGVVYDPIRDELFSASKGSGAQLNGRRLRVANCPNMREALLGTGFAYKRVGISTEDYLKTFSILLAKSADIRRAGAAALDLAYVAAGRLDGFWEMGLKAWDIAAGSLLVREAGGFISDFAGEGDFLSSGQIIAGCKKVYPELLTVLQAAK